MRKLISLFLSLVMVFSMMTGFSSSVSADIVLKGEPSLEQITQIDVNQVVEPYIGSRIGDMKHYSLYEWSGCEAFNKQECIWYDLSSDTPDVALSDDDVCQPGHIYRVSVILSASQGYEFASTVNANISGKAATTSAYKGYYKSKVLQINKVYDQLERKHIDNLNTYYDFDGKVQFLKGVTVRNSSIIAETNYLDNISTIWKYNGTALTEDTVVQHGNWGFITILTANEGYYFDESSTITVDGIKISPSDILLNNRIAWFEVSDDFYTIECTHDYSENYSSDATTHWYECSICGDKKDIDTHSFGAGVKEGDITTYTCTTCDYKKVEKYKDNGFLYADCEGGVQIVAYEGSETNVAVPATLSGKNVVSIADYAFVKYDNKTSITNITLPDTVTSIGRGAFDGCTALESVNIPAGVTRIEAETFMQCESLSSVTLPYGIEYIGESAFQGCGIKNLVLPCSVKTIGKQAFRECPNLETIVIPDGVTEVGQGTFMASEALTSVVVGDKITQIPQSMFDGCSALESVTLPSGLTNVANYAFDRTNLTTVNFRGTEEQWNDISITSSTNYNKKLIDATKNYNYSTKVDVGQHKHSAVQVVAPTCVDEGFTLNVCLGCGDSYKSDVKEATGVHSYNSAVIKEATSEEEGEMVYICKACGHSYSKAIPKLAKSTIDIQKCSVSGIVNKTYTGKVLTQSVTVKYGTSVLVKDTDYTVGYKNNKYAGTATVTITGKGNYTGTVTKTFIIAKAKNTVKITVKGKSVKAKKLKNKKSIVKPLTIKKARGTITVTKVKKGTTKAIYKKIKVNKKTGAITINKGNYKKKTYKVKLKIAVKGNANYKAKTIKKTVKIKIK